MDKVVRFSDAQRRELFSEAAARLGMTPAVVEKDFWVTWVLDRLFATPELARLLMFKGGTSLSKVYGLIERFSEDVDLILDWRVLGGDDPLGERSRTKQAELNEAIDQGLHRRTTAGQSRCRPRGDLRMPRRRGRSPCDRGPLSGGLRRYLPASGSAPGNRSARCLAAPRGKAHLRLCREGLPRLVRPAGSDRANDPGRTHFLGEGDHPAPGTHRPEDSPQPARYSRHYYDLARMAASPVKAASLADRELLAGVVAFKQRFYPRPWARYDLAVPGSLRLLPGEQKLATVEADYRAMADMIFGAVPDFADIVAQLRALEDEINRSG